MYVTLDYDEKYNKGIIKSENASLIREHFSVEDESAKIKKAKYSKYKKFIKNRKYIITDTNRFDIAFYFSIVDYLKELNTKTPVNLFVTNSLKEKVDEFKFKDRIDLVKLNVVKNGIINPPRSYQVSACESFLKNGRGIVLLSTAGGKSLICGMISESINRKFGNGVKIMISVPTIQLVEQTFSDLISYGIDPNLMGKWYGTSDFEEKSIMVVSTGKLYSHLDNIDAEMRKVKLALKTVDDILREELNPSEQQKWGSKKVELIVEYSKLNRKLEDAKKIRGYISSLDLLIIDECHKWKKGSEIEAVFKYLKTPHILGLTGTLPEDQIDTWSLFGKIGPIIYTVPREFLVDEGYISDCEVNILELEYESFPNYKLKGGKDNYILELEFLKKSEFRNSIIKKICSNLSKNILITADHIDHLNLLYSNISSLSGKKVHLVVGEVEVETREKIRKLLENGDKNVVIAQSRIFSTGISIDNLHYIILASAGKAKVTLIQSIGRSVRLHASKSLSTIFDITSSNLMYESRHKEKRKNEYDREGIKYRTKKIREKR